MSLLDRAAIIASLMLVVQPNSAGAFDWVGDTFDGIQCSGKGQGFGPWDFYDVDESSDPDWQAGRWWEVREIHVKPGLAALNALPFDHHAYNRAADEFDYVLRAFPNHPHILGAVIELEFRRRQAPSRITPWRTPPECYLKRAKAFRPLQPHIDVLMGYYLQKLNRVEEALSFYRSALELDENCAEAYYNLGLAYFDLGNYELAENNAKRAYALGFPLEGLRHKLERVEAWK